MGAGQSCTQEKGRELDAKKAGQVVAIDAVTVDGDDIPVAQLAYANESVKKPGARAAETAARNEKSSIGRRAATSTKKRLAETKDDGGQNPKATKKQRHAQELFTYYSTFDDPQLKRTLEAYRLDRVDDAAIDDDDKVDDDERQKWIQRLVKNGENNFGPGGKLGASFTRGAAAAGVMGAKTKKLLSAARGKVKTGVRNFTKKMHGMAAEKANKRHDEAVKASAAARSALSGHNEGSLGRLDANINVSRRQVKQDKVARKLFLAKRRASESNRKAEAVEKGESAKREARQQDVETAQQKEVQTYRRHSGGRKRRKHKTRKLNKRNTGRRRRKRTQLNRNS